MLYAIIYLLFLLMMPGSIAPAGQAGGGHESEELPEYLEMLDEHMRDDYALHRACRQGRSLDAVLIIENEQNYNIVDENRVARSVHRIDDKGKLPIHYAIDREDTLTLHLLIGQYRANLNYIFHDIDQDIHVEPALHYALRRDKLRSATSIIRSQGVDLSLVYNGQTPLDIAQMRNDERIITLIEDKLAKGNNH